MIMEEFGLLIVECPMDASLSMMMKELGPLIVECPEIANVLMIMAEFETLIEEKSIAARLSMMVAEFVLLAESLVNPPIHIWISLMQSHSQKILTRVLCWPYIRLLVRCRLRFLERICGVGLANRPPPITVSHTFCTLWTVDIFRSTSVTKYISCGNFAVEIGVTFPIAVPAHEKLRSSIQLDCVNCRIQVYCVLLGLVYFCNRRCGCWCCCKD